MRLEERIMIGAEMSRGALTMNGGIEHAAEARRLNGPTVHTESDDATRALVHDHKDPVAPKHGAMEHAQ